MDGSISSDMSLSSFESIPGEILEQILDYLDQWTLPQSNFRLQPSPGIFTTTSTAKVDLKSLSLVSRSCHHAILPRLFRDVRIIHSIIPCAANETQKEPFSWVDVISDLAGFLGRHGLGSCVQSFTLRVEGSHPAHYRQSSNTSEDQWILYIEKQWQNLFKLISGSLRQLTILASPYCLGMLLSIKLDPYIDEALHMPYHLLILERSRLFPTIQDSEIAKPGIPSSSLVLTDIKWTGMLLNEGSFLRYHADGTRNWHEGLLSTHRIDGEPCFPASFRQNIRLYEYITAFPAYEHMILWMEVLESMSNLEAVGFQTIPDRHLLPDPLQCGPPNFRLLADNCDNIYTAILTKIIENPINEQSSLERTPFLHLRILQCTDMPGGEDLTRCRQVAYVAEDYGWKWELYSKRESYSENLEGLLSPSRQYNHRDRLVKK